MILNDAGLKLTTSEQTKRMSFYQHLRYSFYLTAVGGALVSLVVAVASADAVGLLPASAFDFLMSPGYVLVVFSVAFFTTPMVARYFPIAWETKTPAHKNNAKNSFAIRLIVLTGIGLLFVLLGKLLVYFLL